MLGILGPCSDSRCMLEHDHPRSTAAATGASASSAVANLDPAFAAFQAQYSTLYHTGSAARWRRKQDDYFAHSKTNLSAIRQRSMEEVHGVDVSWLHKPGRQGWCLLCAEWSLDVIRTSAAYAMENLMISRASSQGCVDFKRPKNRP